MTRICGRECGKTTYPCCCKEEIQQGKLTKYYYIIDIWSGEVYGNIGLEDYVKQIFIADSSKGKQAGYILMKENMSEKEFLDKLLSEENHIVGI